MRTLSLFVVFVSLMAGFTAEAANSVKKIEQEISSLLQKREELAQKKFGSECAQECKENKGKNCVQACLSDSALGDDEWVEMSAKIQELYIERNEAHEAEAKMEETKIKAELGAINVQMKQVAQKYESACKDACKNHSDAAKCTDDCVFDACQDDKEWKSLTKMRHDLVFGDEE